MSVESSFSYKYFVYVQEARTATFKKTLGDEECPENGYVDLCTHGRAEPVELPYGLHLIIKSSTELHPELENMGEQLTAAQLQSMLKLGPNDQNLSKYLVALNSSNFHKGILRGLVDSSVQSAYYLLLHEPALLLKQLSFAVFQDVCMIDTYPAIIWLFIAVSSGVHVLNALDVDMLINSIITLNNSSEFHDDLKIIQNKDNENWSLVNKFRILPKGFDHRKEAEEGEANTAFEKNETLLTLVDIEKYFLSGADSTYTNDILSEEEINTNIILSLAYSMYIGQKDESNNNAPMLTDHDYYFILRTILCFADKNIESDMRKIICAGRGQIDYSKYDLSLKMIPLMIESVDMTSFPQILSQIYNTLNQTNNNTTTTPELSIHDIRQLIAMVESAVNHRKQFTIEISKHLEDQPEWKRIKPILYAIRGNIFRPLEDDAVAGEGEAEAEKEKKVDDEENVAAGEA